MHYAKAGAKFLIYPGGIIYFLFYLLERKFINFMFSFQHGHWTSPLGTLTTSKVNKKYQNIKYINKNIKK